MLMRVTPRVKKQENHLEILGGAVPWRRHCVSSISTIQGTCAAAVLQSLIAIVKVLT